jgi:hypothetical protein
MLSASRRDRSESQEVRISCQPKGRVEGVDFFSIGQRSYIRDYGGDKLGRGNRIYFKFMISSLG